MIDFSQDKEVYMANTTFQGPIRSESTIKTISKNASTGTITEVITMGDAPVALGRRRQNT